MTTQVSHELAEVLSRPVAGGAAARLEVETVAQPQAAAAAAAGIAAETAASPWQPPLQAALLYVEGATRPQPPVAAAAFVVEVLRRDTAAADVRTSAIDAFGQSPWPDAPCGVFAFRHDWATPLVERLQWQSSVVRTASGVEVRSAQRFVPRRLMRYSLGHGSAHDALVVDWLADHLGALAWWPLPQYAVVLEQPVPAGAVAIDAQGIVPDGFLPAQHQPVLDRDGQSWEVGDGHCLALAIEAERWQVLTLTEVQTGRLWLAQPLARPLGPGALVMPLVRGVADATEDMALWRPGVAEGQVWARLAVASAPQPEDDPPDPMLDGLPVWPDANWSHDPQAAGSGEITLMDHAPADPWLRRDDPWPTTTLQRRYLAAGTQQIAQWRARLYRMQGRVGECWSPDGVAPVLRVSRAAAPDDGFLRVSGAGPQAYWHRPAAAIILHPDGSRQHVLTGPYHHDHGGVLVLRSGLDAAVPTGSRLIRLVHCRLDHDAVDLHWHTPWLVEISLRLRVLPPQRGMTEEDGAGGGPGGEEPPPS